MDVCWLVLRCTAWVSNIYIDKSYNNQDWNALIKVGTEMQGMAKLGKYM